MTTPKRHITLTGYYVGKILCGDIRNDKDIYSHIGKWLDNPELKEEICKDCLKLYKES